jgi:glycosyltransferase involved in cell wall biosynthesis
MVHLMETNGNSLKMKRICHMSSVHRGLDIRIFHKECVSLAKAGYETHLITNATQDEVKEAALHGVKLHALQFVPETKRLSRMIFHSYQCYRLAKKLNADLYHLHDPELMPYGLILAGAGKQVIFDAHEDLSGSILSKEWIPRFARNSLSKLFSFVERLFLRKFSAVIAATPFIETLFDGIKTRVSVVSNFPVFGELVRGIGNNISQRNSVCYVGGIEEARGIKESVKAIEKVDCPLLIAGRFSSSMLRDEVSKFPGWIHVKEYGFVDRDSIACIMNQSFCGLVTLYPVPNYVNALPIKMFEYMSAGVPVIASDFPLWKNIIESHQCGICVNPKEPSEIAAALIYLRDHPDEVVRMGENGRQAVENFYRWDIEEKELLSLYRNILFEKDAHYDKQLKEYGNAV